MARLSEAEGPCLAVAVHVECRPPGTLVASEVSLQGHADRRRLLVRRCYRCMCRKSRPERIASVSRENLFDLLRTIYGYDADFHHLRGYSMVQHTSS
jgi:hypothetical protein